DAGIISRQGGQAVGRGLVFGVVEFGSATGLLISLIESPDQRSGDRNGGDSYESRQHLAGKPHDRWPFTAQAQPGNRLAALARLSLFGFVHHASLPSVRTIRTRRSEPRAPRRSSAAANRRSTIMWLLLTR